MCGQAYERALDDAIRLLAKGYGAEWCALQFPMYTADLYPVLLVLEDMVEAVDELLPLPDEQEAVEPEKKLVDKRLEPQAELEPQSIP